MIAGPAFAAPTITFATPASDGSTSATFNNNGISAGDFTDTYTFTLPAGLVSSTISSIFTTEQMNNVSFSAVTLNGVAYNILSQGQVEFRTLIADPIANGVQTLIVTGNSGGNASYSGTLSFAAAATGAVPEPAAWAMMILGMGAIGFAMRRQKVATRVSYSA